MTIRRPVVAMLLLLTALPWIGCLGGKPLRGPAPPEQPAPPPREDLKPHLLGTWENTDKNGKSRQMIFETGGGVTFKGGLEFYNPGRWELDPDRRELRITFPEADVDKLQVFQLYRGQGVKSFDPAQKRITYAFDDQTWMLNIAGWEYSKAQKSLAAPADEPVLK